MILRLRPRLTTSLELAVTGMLLGIAVSLNSTVWSVYLNTILHDAALTGTIAAATTGLYVVLLFALTPILRRASERLLLTLSAAGIAAGYLGYALTDSLWPFLAAAAAVAFFQVMRAESYSVLVRDNADGGDVPQAEGMRYAINNAGWLLAPLLGGFVAAALGLRMVFLVGAIFSIIAMMQFRMVPTQNVPHDDNDLSYRRLLKDLRTFAKDPALRRAYIMNGGVSTWWGVIYTYGPLYILHQGLPVYWVGIFLAAITIPLIVLEYTVGRLTKRYGYRFFLVLGHAWIAACAIAVAILTPYTWATLTILVLASVGASMLEGTRESYFYAVVPQKDEERHLGTWLSGQSLMSTLGKFAFAGAILIASYAGGFLITAALMVAAALVASRITVQIPERKPA